MGLPHLLMDVLSPSIGVYISSPLATRLLAFNEKSQMCMGRGYTVHEKLFDQNV